MMIGLAQARPPYIEFYVTAVDDPKRSVEVGYRVTKDVEMVRIIQPGSRDNLLKPAQQWLDEIKRKFLEGTHDCFPEEWISAFRKKYELWKEGLEAPPMGTSVKEWPLLSPAQVQNLLACRLLTIEDVAEMTEQAMLQFGMGARELKEKAREWIKGKEVANAIAQENQELKKELAELRELVASLKAAEVQPYPKKRGRPAKEKLAA